MSTIGAQGDDTLPGTAADDTIEGGAGDDVLSGGDGNDVIAEISGSNTISGGDGDDHITVTDFAQAPSALVPVSVDNTIDAGNGNDYVRIEAPRAGSLTIALGAGDDLLVLGDELQLNVHDVQIGLGSGQDRVVLGFGLGNWLRSDLAFPPIVIHDFDAGAGGDVLNLADFIRGNWFNTTLGVPGTNPFATGHLELVQDGADVILHLDYDGTGPAHSAAYVRDFLRLVDVDAGDLVAENFAGWAPNGDPPTGSVVQGTSGADILFANAIGTTLQGLAGDDDLIGTAGADTLEGGSDNDTLNGSAGNDLLRGGDGDDAFHDTLGNDTIEGGAGNDVIEISRSTALYHFNALHETVSISGGDGEDVVRFSIVREPFTNLSDRSATFIVDLGAGDDRFFAANWASAGTLALGAGQDRVELGQLFFIDYPDSPTTPVPLIRITDFAAGNNGDVLDLGNMLIGAGWDRMSNPFAQDVLFAVQHGDDVLISIGDAEGPLTDVLRLDDVDIAQLTAFNFAGFSPDGAAFANLGLVGTAAGDRLFGAASDDTMAGLDGNDELHGGFGSDTIDGGDGDDVLDGGWGADSLSGGEGNDTLEDLHGGSDIIAGGDGDDRITVNHRDFGGIVDHIVIDAGAGIDTVDFTGAQGSLVVDLGAGDDRIVLRSYPYSGGSTLTLGSGSDVVVLDPSLASQVWGAIVVTDFTPGDGGDRLDWLLYALLESWSPGSAFDGVDFNPFEAGIAVLEQSGADTVLRLLPQFSSDPLVVFENTSVGDFTDHNLGTDISARPPLPETDTQTGSEDADSLMGTPARDVISGLGGNDSIAGAEGNDWLKGGGGDDTLLGGQGDDSLEGGSGRNQVDGGDGDDTIVDVSGLDTIVGGAGADTIRVDATANSTLGSTDAGDGNDTLGILNNIDRPYSATLGAGNDHVVVRGMAGNITLSLGSGHDTIELPDSFSPLNGSVLTVTDFQPGAAGDKIDVDGYLTRALRFNVPEYWTPDSNPFQQGYLDLRQVGGDVELWFHRDGFASGSDARVARFTNTALAQFTAENFDGYDPHATPNHAEALTSGLVVATGQTRTLTDSTPDAAGVRAHYGYLSGQGLINHGTIVTVATTPSGTLAGFAVYNDYGESSLFLNATDGSFTVENQFVDELGPNAQGKTYGFYAFNQAIAFQNDGHFEVEAATGLAYGVLTDYDFAGHDGSVLNTGTFSVSSAYAAWGAQLGGTGGEFENNGTWHVSAAVDAVGLVIHNATSQLVRNAGEFVVEGAETATAVYFNNYGIYGFENAGSIIAQADSASPFESFGVYVGFNDVTSGEGPATFVNSGSITADYAFWINPGEGFATTLRSREEIFNSGEMHGTVGLAYGDDILHNTGLIDGVVDLGEGNDLYDGAAGHLDRYLAAGEGGDTVTGGTRGENFFGDFGNDIIRGGGGSDYIDGGRGADALDGGDGYDILSYIDSTAPLTLYLAAGSAVAAGGTDRVRNFEFVIGSSFADQMTGSAASEHLEGAGGNDTLSGEAGNDTLRGDEGDDSLSGGAGSDAFEFSAGHGHDEISDFRAGGDNDLLNIYGYTGYTSLQQVGVDALVTLSVTDSILLRNVDVATLPTSSIVFSSTPLTASAAPLPAFTQAVNYDLVIGAGEFLRFVDPVPLHISDQEFANHGLVLEALNGLLWPSVFNAGAIRVEATLTADRAVGIASSIPDAAVNGEPHVVNQATGAIDVIATAGGDALGVQTGASSWNLGEISVVSTGGSARGIESQNFRNTFANTGSIEVTAAQDAAGAMMTNSLGFWNLGTIEVSGVESALGVRWIGSTSAFAPMQFVNSGTIQVASSSGETIGLSYGTGGEAPSIWNSGVIEADFAIRNVAWVSPRPAQSTNLYNSGELRGAVLLGRGVDLVLNAGSIDGLLDLRAGDDRYDGRLGSHASHVLGGEGADVLLGGAGMDHLEGGEGADTLAGGAGMDTLTGGADSDTFRFTAGDGNDVITDFVAGAAGGETIDVAGYAGYQSLVQQGTDTRVMFSATDSLLLLNTQATDLVAGNFGFSAADIAPQALPAPPAAPAAPSGAPIVDAPQFPSGGVTDLHATSGNAFTYIVPVSAFSGIDPATAAFTATLADGSALPAWLSFNATSRAFAGTPADPDFGTAHVVVAASDGSASATATFQVEVTTDFIEALRNTDRARWNDAHANGTTGTGLTFSFMASAPAYASADETATFAPMTTAEMQAVREVLQLYQEIAGITFAEVADAGAGGQLRFGTYESAAGTESAYAYSPGADAAAGDVWVNRFYPEYADPSRGDFDYLTLIHEIGHALGLKHPGSYGGGQLPFLPAATDNDQRTVMSYVPGLGELFLDATEDSPGSYVLNYFDVLPSTPMLYDVAAIQFLYGANVATRAGGDTYTFDPSTPFFRTLWDAGGIDTISLANFALGSQIDLRAGHYSSIRILSDPLPPGESGSAGDYNGTDNLAIALGVTIENAIGGSGIDLIFGNSVDNLLDGGLSADHLHGLAGNDTYYVNTQADLVFENLNEGTDTVVSTVSFYLYANVENLMLIGTAQYGVGNNLGNMLSGNAESNLLIGWAGDDTLHGNGGNDILYGVDGDDTIHGEDGIDYFAGGPGNDTIYGGNDADRAYGETGNDTIYGGDDFATDILIGGDGDDVIDGGPAWDQMYGGPGNDTFYVSQQVDWVFEQPGEGHDTVYANSPNGYYLYAEIEDLVLQGNTPFGVGNALDNAITGNAVSNWLLGGAGADTLNGKAGNDVLFGQAGADVFVFERGAGADVIGDFAPGIDTIRLIGIGYASFAALQPHIVQNAGTAAIDLGAGDVVVVNGVPLASLHASDFLFS